jgi:hypothetical protein
MGIILGDGYNANCSAINAALETHEEAELNRYLDATPETADDGPDPDEVFADDLTEAIDELPDPEAE